MNKVEEVNIFDVKIMKLVRKLRQKIEEYASDTKPQDKIHVAEYCSNNIITYLKQDNDLYKYWKAKGRIPKDESDPPLGTISNLNEFCDAIAECISYIRNTRSIDYQGDDISIEITSILEFEKTAYIKGERPFYIKGSSNPFQEG